MSALAVETQYVTDTHGELVRACESVDPEVMFPDDNLDNDAPDVIDAKAVCASCYFKTECLREHVKESWGVWGGMTRKEREALIKRERRRISQPETLFG